MKKIISFQLLTMVIFIFSCRSENDYVKSDYVLKARYLDTQTYEITSYGFAPKNIRNSTQAKNMAKEAALILAQQKVSQEFNVPVDMVIKSGQIKEVEYLNNNSICKMIYIVNTDYLKSLNP